MRVCLDKRLASFASLNSNFLSSFYLPMKKCSRYPLRIGSLFVPLVRLIIILIYPVAKPLAFCLDMALGEELATTYSNSEMMKLLQIHVQQNVIDKETAGAMSGALTYKVSITQKMVAKKGWKKHIGSHRYLLP